MNLGTLNIEAATMAEALALTAAAVASESTGYFCFCESNLLAHSGEPRVAAALAGADAVFADGVVLLLLARVYGSRLPGRVPGPSFMLRACEYGLERGWKHYFYGGSPGVAEALAARLIGRYPALQIVGVHSPPFRELDGLAETDAVLRTIEATGPDLLWVGLGAPKQELWMADHADRIRVPLMIGVGAAFDFHSGTLPWTPSWIRAIGMEWLFRLCLEPRRMWRRNVHSIRFLLRVLQEKRGKGKGKGAEG